MGIIRLKLQKLFATNIKKHIESKTDTLYITKQYVSTCETSGDFINDFVNERQWTSTNQLFQCQTAHLTSVP